MREEMQRPEVYQPFVMERFASWNSDIQEMELEFMKFNLLRGLAKKITLQWYEQEEAEVVWCRSDTEYVPNDEKLRTHVIVDNEDLLRGHAALSSAIIRATGTFGPPGGIGSSPGAPISHHAIIFETDKDETEVVSEIVKHEMENVYKMSVPLAVDIAVGKSWYDTKE